MKRFALVCWLAFALPAAAHHAPRSAGPVTRLADGVYFMQTPTDPEFLGSNVGWVVFEDYVLVIDAGFPLTARSVIEEVRKTTEKPIRFVFDTHYHGDHAYGNGVFIDAGATGVAQTLAVRDMREINPDRFERERTSKSDLSRRLMEGARWKDATIAFEKGLVFDDGKMRVELIGVGHAHTPGDAVAWLPKERVLFTGDVCVNGAFNYMGDGDSANWVRVLTWLEGLRPETIAPGHGPLGKGDLLATQRRYLTELRAHVSKGVDEEKPLVEIRESLEMAWYREWTGHNAKDQTAAVARIFDEVTGRVPPAELVRDLELKPGPPPPGEKPDVLDRRKVLVPNYPKEKLARLRAVAPLLNLVPVANPAEAVKEVADADAVIGMLSRDILVAGMGKKLRWVQIGSAGVDRYVDIPELKSSGIVLTNAQRLYGPEIADHVVASILAVTRGLRESIPAQSGERPWSTIRRGRSNNATELLGKTAFVAGLGGIGTEVAKRLHGFGMTVIATRSRPAERPDYVFKLSTSEDTKAFVAEADVVVNCLPLTKETEGLFDAAMIGAMKKGAIYANVGRGKTTDTQALVEALKAGNLAGAALDVTDPEPLPDGHPLWTMPNVVVTPHSSAASDMQEERLFMLYRENLRRFARHEPLLSVVSLERGY